MAFETIEHTGYRLGTIKRIAIYTTKQRQCGVLFILFTNTLLSEFSLEQQDRIGVTLAVDVKKRLIKASFSRDGSLTLGVQGKYQSRISIGIQKLKFTFTTKTVPITNCEIVSINNKEKAVVFKIPPQFLNKTTK